MARLQPVTAPLTPAYTWGDRLCLLIHGLDLGDETLCSGAASSDCPVLCGAHGTRGTGLVDRTEA